MNSPEWPPRSCPETNKEVAPSIDCWCSWGLFYPMDEGSRAGMGPWYEYGTIPKARTTTWPTWVSTTSFDPRRHSHWAFRLTMSLVSLDPLTHTTWLGLTYLIWPLRTCFPALDASSNATNLEPSEPDLLLGPISLSTTLPIVPFAPKFFVPPRRLATFFTIIQGQTSIIRLAINRSLMRTSIHTILNSTIIYWGRSFGAWLTRLQIPCLRGSNNRHIGRTEKFRTCLLFVSITTASKKNLSRGLLIQVWIQPLKH